MKKNVLGAALSFLLIITLSCGSSPTSSKGSSRELISHSFLAGPLLSVDIDGDYLYAGSYGALHILSIADKENPVLIGGVPLRWSFRDIKVHGNFVYFTTYNSNSDQFFCMYDVSDPENPRLVDIFEDTDHIKLTDIWIQDNFAYVVHFDGFSIFDISSGSSINRVGEYESYDSRETPIAVAGNYAYICRTQYLEIVDISNPAATVLADTVNLADDPILDLYIENNLLYVIFYYTGLKIYDISSPLTPQFLGELPGDFRRITVKDDIAFAYKPGSNYSDIAIIDVNDPYNPTLASVYNALNTHKVAIVDEYIYVTGYEYNCDNFTNIINVSNPQIPQLVNTYRASRGANQIHVTGNIAYGVNECGFEIADVSDPRNPRVLSNYNTLNHYSAFAEKDGYVYLAVRESPELRVISALDPLNPHQVSSLSIEGGSRGSRLYINDNILYFTAGDNSTYVINIENPFNTEIIYRWADVECLHVAGNICYAAGHNSFELDLYDVSDIQNPELISTVDIPGRVQSIIVKSDYLYVATSPIPPFLNSKISIYNIHNPANPILLSVLDEEYLYAGGMYFDQGYLYLANRQRNGVDIISVHNPSNPRHVDQITTPGNANDVHVQGNYIFIADGSSMLIYRNY